MAEEKEKIFKDIGREFFRKGLPKIGGALIRVAGAAASKTPVGAALDEIGVFDAVADALGLDPTDERKIEDKVKGMSAEELQSLTKIKELEADIAVAEIERSNIIDQELTKRHETDANTDSWITKHVRPITLLFLTFTYVLYVYLITFVLTAEEVQSASGLGEQLSWLLGGAYAFYFGGRSWEKVKK